MFGDDFNLFAQMEFFKLFKYVIYLIVLAVVVYAVVMTVTLLVRIAIIIGSVFGGCSVIKNYVLSFKENVIDSNRNMAVLEKQK